MRLFFGVGGPNFTSSFHVIGEIFDKVYNLGGLTNPLKAFNELLGPTNRAALLTMLPRSCGNYTRLTAVSPVASWFETREDALLTMRK